MRNKRGAEAGTKRQTTSRQRFGEERDKVTCSPHGWGSSWSIRREEDPGGTRREEAEGVTETSFVIPFSPRNLFPFRDPAVPSSALPSAGPFLGPSLQRNERDEDKGKRHEFRPVPFRFRRV